MRKCEQTIQSSASFLPIEQQLGAQISWEPSARHLHKSHVCSCATKIDPHTACLSWPRGTWQDREVCRDILDPCPCFPWCWAAHQPSAQVQPPAPPQEGHTKTGLDHRRRCLADGLILVWGRLKLVVWRAFFQCQLFHERLLDLPFENDSRRPSGGCGNGWQEGQGCAS